uniref:Uncharacterized protein n=1 Tax=Anguilla anguilla TaxID=7936 RepID=A0A0E9XMC8_ANGAN
MSTPSTSLAFLCGNPQSLTLFWVEIPKSLPKITFSLNVKTPLCLHGLLVLIKTCTHTYVQNDVRIEQFIQELVSKFAFIWQMYRTGV